MWQEVGSALPEIAVLRKLLFASVNIPKQTPHYWEELIEFAYNGRVDKPPDAEKVRVLLENMELLDQMAFTTDDDLKAELLTHKSCIRDKPLGVILISHNSTCKLCGGKLVVRSDRPSYITLYTDAVKSPENI